MLAAVVVIFTFVPHTFTSYLSSGQNPMNTRGHSEFRSAAFEIGGKTRISARVNSSFAGVQLRRFR
jgi:hypothetical protein